MDHSLSTDADRKVLLERKQLILGVKIHGIPW
jgi:hypothetical protein